VLKKWLSLVSLLVIAALAFTACGGDDEEEAAVPAAATALAAATTQPAAPATAAPATAAPIVPVPTSPPSAEGDIFSKDRFGGVLKWVPASGVGNLDSMASGAGTSRVSWHFWEVLAVWDDKGVVQPDMLESWDLDGSTYTFVLRDGLKWHDGGTPGSADVEASMERWRELDKAFAPTINDKWVGFETISNKSFSITLTAPTGLLMAGLGYVGGRQLNIMPKATSEKFPGAELVTDFNASGPYQLINWDQGNEIIMDRFEDYVPRTEAPSYRAGAKLAYFDRLHMLEIPDQQTRVSALLTGEVDYLSEISPDFYELMQENSDKVSISLNPPGTRPDLMFNMHDPLIGGPAGERGKLIRLAIQAAVDAEDIMRVYGPRELWKLCPSLWFCDTVWGPAGINEERYNVADPARARELLKQAGYNNEPIVITNPTDLPVLAPQAAILEQQLEAVGINASILVADWATILQHHSSGEGWQIFTDAATSNLYHPLVTHVLGATKTSTNYPPDYVTGVKLLALKKEFAEAIDLDAQLAIARKMADLFWEDPPTIILGQLFALWVYDNDIKGFEARGAPVQSPILYNLWWDDAKRRADDPR
jgi:peptide/nickel transport system substrate-binding protein